MLRWTTLGVLALATIGTTFAHDYKAGEITFDHPWARATAAGQPNGAAYMTIANAGAADRIVAAESSVSPRVELHTHLNEAGVMRMRQVEAIDLPAGETVALAPGGLHVMLMGLSAPLAEGQTFPLTLVLEQGGRIELEVKVEAASYGSGAGHGHGHGHGHGN